MIQKLLKKLIKHTKINATQTLFWFNYEGARIKILKGKEIFTCKDTPGKIINKNFTVSCQENAIQILEIQKEGKKKLNISDYLKGNSLKIGSYVD